MKKEILIIPGFGESTKDAGYKEIIETLKKRGYFVIEYNPKWEDKTIVGWMNGFEDLIKKHNTENITLIGFSFGAYISALASSKYNFNKIIFASLSPYFKEDIKKLPKIAYKMLGKRRIEKFSKHNFPFISETEACFIVGDQDIDLVIERVKESYKIWSGKKTLTILKGVPHDINYPDYIKKIVSEV